MKNVVILIGNVGTTPQTNEHSSANVVTISLATSEQYRDKDGNLQKVTDWHTIKAWNGLADLAISYIDKGSRIEVQGKIKHDQYKDKDGITRYVSYVLADEILLLDRKPEPVQ